MNHWDNLQTPQVKLRRRSSIFNIVLPEQSVQNENDFEKHKLALQQEASDWVHLLKNQNKKLKLIQNQKFEENPGNFSQNQITFLDNKLKYAELGEEIANINDKVFSYIKRKEYLVKKYNFYTELLDEKILECALEILPQAFI